MQRIARGLAVALAVATAAGCGGTRTVTETTTVTVTTKAATGLGSPRQQVLFGHIAALDRTDGTFELEFDPAWFLSGETANAAAAEDGAVDPGQPVPNDNYRVEEGHRLLVFHVEPSARVTVLTRHGTGQFGATPISVGELEEIVAGTSSLRLFEPLDSGVWITVAIDAVLAIEQQYQP